MIIRVVAYDSRWPALYAAEARRLREALHELGERTHQVHSFEVSSGEADRHLAFRDCLISHPQVAEEYAELKRGLARRFPSDIYGYMDGKNAFVKHHEARALEWRAGPARTSEESGEACTWKGGVLPVRSLDNDSVTCEEN